jgi:hypothetical protein
MTFKGLGQWSQPFEGESTFPVLAIFAILLKWKSPKEGGLARKALERRSQQDVREDVR